MILCFMILCPFLSTLSRWRRRLVVLTVVAGVCAALWLWWERHIRVVPNTSLAVETQRGHPDFRGEWQLDLDASESLDPILEAKGKNLALRRP